MKAKFFVIEYIYTNEANPEFKVALYNWHEQQADAEKFCQMVKEFGGSVNIRTRDIEIPA